MPPLPTIQHSGPAWQPIQPSERHTALDLLRGFALFGVLLVNLLYFFRLSLFQHIAQFHSRPGWANHAVDLLIAELLEFKAFDLFSLTFGVGLAVQAERARLRGVSAPAFLMRRLAILLAFGACHMLLVSNVDILTLYAVCGLFILPLLRLPAPVLAFAALAAIYLPTLFPQGPILPPAAVLLEHAATATRIYSQGSFADLVSFRWHETRQLIAPLLIGSAQKTWGLMLLGVAVWRWGVVRQPLRYSGLLWVGGLACGVVGIVNTTADVLSESSGTRVEFAPVLHIFGSHVPLAFAYAAALLLATPSPRFAAWTAPVAAAGRMALSNYLAQSLLFSVLFYGYGLGLFGRLGSAVTAVIGVAVYGAQLWFSAWWLQRYRFGPFEWLWRSLTYGRRQPMRLAA